ncbi:MAG TPA: polysaccharide deacetylase family protein [Xanthobacteraceae bacterium]|nr:polysaccharide deacetylase family protein [Xanthobacteraceae bacterium]
MRVLVIVVAALATLGLAAFGVIAAQRATQHGGVLLTASGTHAATALAAKPAAAPAPKVAQASVAAPLQAPIAAPTVTPPAPVPAAAPTRIAEAQNANPGAPSAAPTPTPQAGSQGAAAKPAAPACDKPGGMGLARTVQIDTTGGPAFGFEHFKQYDFLAEHEVVLTFDDGPWPGNTAAVIKALTDQCVKATFFEIGEHATWHPEISKIVAEAGMTIGSHTWSHKDLARNPYASNIELAKQEIEMGVSAVHKAVGGPIAPFFRFPDLQQPPELLAYLGSRNISTFSTDLDSFDFKMRRPEQVIKSVMTKLEKRGKGIVLMHDFQHATAEAMPELLRQLKAAGFKIVHMVPKAPVTTLAKYDDMLRQQDKMDATNTRPQNSVVKTISGN